MADVKVKFVEPVMNRGRVHKPGEFMSLDEGVAKLWKENGWVVFVKDEIAKLEKVLNEVPEKEEKKEEETIKMVEKKKTVKMVGPKVVHEPKPMKAVKKPAKKATKKRKG